MSGVQPQAGFQGTHLAIADASDHWLRENFRTLAVVDFTGKEIALRVMARS